MPSLSIIVPTLREAPLMAALAAHLTQVAPHAQLVVVDGESDDGTAETARAAGLRVVSAPAGRWRQMNAGAAVTEGDALLFLHADTRLPAGAEALVATSLADPRVALGAFGFRLDERSPSLAVVEWGARLRNAVAAMPYGDQGLFLRRGTFEALGGFAPMAALEDLDLVTRARALGRVVVRPEVAITSARRYRTRGALRLMLTHWWLAGRFQLGWRPGLDPIER